MQKRNQTASVPPSVLPIPEVAVAMYEHTGGQLTLIPKFGSDPLEVHIYSDLQDARNQGFTAKYPDLEPVFSSVVNGNDHPFTSGLKYFISLATCLSHSI